MYWRWTGAVGLDRLEIFPAGRNHRLQRWCGDVWLHVADGLEMRGESERETEDASTASSLRTGGPQGSPKRHSEIKTAVQAEEVVPVLGFLRSDCVISDMWYHLFVA